MKSLSACLAFALVLLLDLFLLDSPGPERTLGLIRHGLLFGLAAALFNFLVLRLWRDDLEAVADSITVFATCIGLACLAVVLDRLLRNCDTNDALTLMIATFTAINLAIEGVRHMRRRRAA